MNNSNIDGTNVNIQVVILSENLKGMTPRAIKTLFEGATDLLGVAKMSGSLDFEVDSPLGHLVDDFGDAQTTLQDVLGDMDEEEF